MLASALDFGTPWGAAIGALLQCEVPPLTLSSYREEVVLADRNAERHGEGRGINEIDHTVHQYKVGREDAKFFRDRQELAEAEAISLSRKGRWSAASLSDGRKQERQRSTRPQRGWRDDIDRRRRLLARC